MGVCVVNTGVHITVRLHDRVKSQFTGRHMTYHFVWNTRLKIWMWGI